MSTTPMTTGTNKLATVARILLGMLFALSGLNHLLWFVPMPPMTGDTALFFSGLQQTGYFFALLGAVEVAAGLLLVAGRLVPLALAAIAPIAVNVVAFHIVLAPAGLPVALLVVAASLYLAWKNRDAFAPLLRARSAAPAARVRAIEWALGLVFIASGIAGLVGATPPPSTAGAAVMMKGLTASGYFMPFIGIVEVLAGGLLIARRFVGLALIAMAPLVVEILAYRLYVSTPTMLVVGLALVAAQAWVVYAHRGMFAGLYTRRV